ncbi:MAG: hypothetical protein KatS3mg010_0343 [Acidimicrobiia bacterium]|nr:MAG: hypothetical protein KatS3mg010_0343 [Acidimicrobiia bacterium]
MIYTSGTTGRPKGALRTSTDRNLVFALLAELNLLHENATHLTTGPLYHSGPLAFASLAHTLGTPIVVAAQVRSRAVARAGEEHRVTNTFSAPTQLKRIVSLPPEELATADMSSMVCLIANAAPVPYSLKQEIVEKLGDGFLYEVYGSTELGVDTVLKPEDQLRKPGSCGKPYGGIEIRIVKEDGTMRGRNEPASCSCGRRSRWTATTAPRSSSRSSTTASGSRSATSRTWTTRATSTSATGRRT